MSAEELQRVFKTLSDPTRVRILGVLEREELAVQELMDVV
jgi:DNA-binding transcriptional ArsR family regulator